MSEASKAFEEVVIEAFKVYEARGEATLDRCGVKCVPVFVGGVMQTNPITKKPYLRAIKSLPDFEGTTQDGWQFMFDCKVAERTNRVQIKDSTEEQIEILKRRSTFGTTTFLAVHFPHRETPKKKIETPQMTFLFPVDPGSLYWMLKKSDGETADITREDCLKYGVGVPWVKLGKRDRKERPDILAGIRKLRDPDGLFSRDEKPRELFTPMPLPVIEEAGDAPW